MFALLKHALFASSPLFFPIFRRLSKQTPYFCVTTVPCFRLLPHF